MMANDFSTSFHITDILVLLHCGCLSQSIKLRGAMYFDMATLFHKLFVVMSLQPIFATSAEEKSSSFLMPHPPHFFSSVSASHLT